jgi:hypothetical protein
MLTISFSSPFPFLYFTFLLHFLPSFFLFVCSALPVTAAAAVMGYPIFLLQFSYLQNHNRRPHMIFRCVLRLMLFIFFISMIIVRATLAFVWRSLSNLQSGRDLFFSLTRSLFCAYISVILLPLSLKKA